ncbi:hypothetical protein GGR56DRAFT_614490 [Xylariaceae sp. FL0804]|nr:hypothetical protein GGR56DRAFT_614490 [Xylariaceae sp. FL0804]
MADDQTTEAPQGPDASPRRYSWSQYKKTWWMKDAMVDGRWDIVESWLQNGQTLGITGATTREEFVKKQGYRLLPRVTDKAESVKWLLDYGIGLDVPQSEFENLPKGQWNNTLAVLNAAAKKGNMASFDLLVSRGADPARSNPLTFAAQYQDSDSKVDAVITHLIKTYNYDVNADDLCGGLASNFANWSLAPMGHVHGPALVYAFHSRNFPAVRSLIRHGAHKDIYGFPGESTLRDILESSGPERDAEIRRRKRFRNDHYPPGQSYHYD